MKTILMHLFLSAGLASAGQAASLTDPLVFGDAPSVANHAPPGDFSPVTAPGKGWVDKGHCAGAAMRAARNNRVNCEKWFGNYTPETERLIACAGKWLAAATLMSLVDEGKLSLADPAAKWLPEFRVDLKGAAAWRRMFSHTSGFTPCQPKDNPGENSPKNSRIEPLNLAGTHSTASRLYSKNQGRGGTRPAPIRQEVHGEKSQTQTESAAHIAPLKSSAADWQWSVEVEPLTIGNSSSHPRAFLWIPPGCQRVRGVVFGQNNMIEEGILEHREFRETLAKLGIAELFVAPTFDTWQSATNNDATNEKFNALLKTFAAESGYDELEFAPVIPMGHSAMASFPWNFAAWNPQRTLAILSVHGDAPQTTLVGNGRPNVDWGGRNIDGIPGLMVMGEYEWWEDRLTPVFPFRAKHPAVPVSVVCDAGHGHFDYSDELVRYLALFIRKATEQRRPDLSGRRRGNASQTGKNLETPRVVSDKLRAVDPRDGWWMDRWRKNQAPRAKAAQFAKYSGDQTEAFWTFDRDTAEAAEQFNPQSGKAPQLVGFVQDGQVIEQTPNTHEQIRLKVPAMDDSLTFKLTGAFLDSVPAGKNPALWTGLTNGTPLGHARGGGPVILSRISGPVMQTAPDSFAVRFNRSAIPADRRAGDLWLLASHPGDAKYKSAVQQALLHLPAQLTEGAAQRITFPEIGSVKNGTESLKLNATSDAGAPVYYFVREGPAVVEGDLLKFTGLPPRAKFPIKVTVIAWQWGRNTDPKLKSAEPVTRSFQIIK